MIDDFFIIESISDQEVQDGNIFKSALNSIKGFNPQYHFVNNYSQFIDKLKEFAESEYLYLLISCHGDHDNLYLTEETLEFEDLDDYKFDYSNKRVFMSSCKGGNNRIAKYFISNGCYSVVGSPDNINQIIALVIWPTMLIKFEEMNNTVINFEEIDKALKAITKFYKIRLSYYSFKKDKDGYKEYSYDENGKRRRVDY